MQLAARTLRTGDNRRLTIDYRDWLWEGAHLSSATVSVPGGTHSSVGTQSFDEGRKRLYFYIQAGSISEIFTATVQVTSTDGQIVSDTIAFTVQNP